jgi:hypothetical protein
MVSLCLVILSTGVLVIPSMEHRLVESGRSTNRLVRATNACAGIGLVPLTASLGLSTYGCGAWAQLRNCRNPTA